jgi:hypothetical protein
MAVCYLLLIVFFQLTGGYKQVHLEAAVPSPLDGQPVDPHAFKPAALGTTFDAGDEQAIQAKE